MPEQRELVRLLGTKFIQRRDVKAFQADDGAWYPERSSFTMKDFTDHLAGTRTLGHYLLDQDDMCKFFAFDLDLVQHGEQCPAKLTPGTKCSGCPVTFPNLIMDEKGDPQSDLFWTVNPREAWQDPNHPARETLIIEMRCLAEGLALRAHRTLNMPVAIATSGHKGLHVYVFTDGPLPAEASRQLAIGLLDGYGCFEPVRGQHFWRHTTSYKTLEIEVFPKQTSLEGKDLGNLMKLPLGVHRVTGQRAEFLTTKCGYNRLIPMDPIRALEGDLPWE